jgi:hypothetical protein
MEKVINVYDGLISKEMQNEVHEYACNHTWYSALRHLNDYDATLDPLNTELGEGERGIIRHPFGNSTDMVKTRHPLIYNLFQDINDKVLGGKANIDGIPEDIGGLKSIRTSYSDGKNFFDKYEYDNTIKGWTCYMNAKSSGSKRVQQIRNHNPGYIHKDSGPGYIDKNNYATVLFVTNSKWLPSWGAEYVFYSDKQDDGEVHPKGGYPIGFPEQIVGHKPGRIIVYRHDQNHISFKNAPDSDGMPVRIAFRVNLNDN